MIKRFITSLHKLNSWNKIFWKKHVLKYYLKLLYSKFLLETSLPSLNRFIYVYHKMVLKKNSSLYYYRMVKTKSLCYKNVFWIIGRCFLFRDQYNNNYYFLLLLDTQSRRRRIAGFLHLEFTPSFYNPGALLSQTRGILGVSSTILCSGLSVADTLNCTTGLAVH